MFPDGTFRFHQGGEDFGGLCVLGTFSQYAVVHEYSVIKIPNEIGFDVAALVACGVPTGWGSAVRAGGVRAGQTVVIYGAGGVGSNAVQGASLAGAKNVIVVDPVEFKRKMATTEFGATHAFASAEEAHEFVVETTWGELADHAIITVGILHDEVIKNAIKVVGKTGQVTITAVGNGWVEREPRHADRLPAPDPGLDLRRLQPAVDVPLLIGLYQAGKLKLDELITRRYRLDEINEGYQDMLDGKNIRGVIIHEHFSQQEGNCRDEHHHSRRHRPGPARRLGDRRPAARRAEGARGPGQADGGRACATPTTTSPRATPPSGCRSWAGTRAPASSSRSAPTCSGSSRATRSSAPTSRPAAPAVRARPGTRTCA